MPPRSWAQIVGSGAGMKPSPLRQDITINMSEFPSTLSTVPVTSSATLAIAHGTWADVAARPDSEVSASLASSETDLKTESGVVGVGLTTSPKSETSSSSSSNNTTASSGPSISSTVAANTTTRAPISNIDMVSKKRQAAQASKAKARRSMKQAVDRAIGVPAIVEPPSPSAGKKKREKKVKEDKGKGIAADSSEEEDFDGFFPDDATTAEEKAAAAAAAAKKREENLAKAKRAFEALERDRRRQLFESSDGFDVTLIFGKDKTCSLAHREILIAESTWFAEHLPPADEDGQTTLFMEGCSAPMVGPVLSFLYTGVLPGMTFDPARKWDLRFVVFNVTNYRTSAKLEIKSGLDHFLGNIKAAVDYYGPLLGGQFYHYKFYKKGSMESLEIPLRMCYINMYEEEEKPAEMRELKLQVARLFMVVMPFVLRQPSFKGPIKQYWTSLNFPWREDMKGFYEEGLLNEYAQMFDRNGDWIDEEDPESEPLPEWPAVPGPSSAAPSHYAASIDEMTQKMRDAGIANF
ncbi:hypothetical protein CkaCkLH20_02527 [Colletotrichum karsti]|uniref:BTB domain-containing protein n=1 Tax=Colletotrichum karsti TaxID=1095194 RepID=A0A9P6ID89_9PEZI|nr:uncharacterized protein CkaCkLH20_02527 [Colletotrichum karsti]KAF9879716.1 hypothetical protein CkaCkLH20_02527 [Colletotrichum karsti]